MLHCAYMKTDRERWDARYAERAQQPYPPPDDWLTEHRELLAGRGRRALDLACGWGQNALWLAEQGYEVDAVDISGVALARGREEAARRGLRVRFIQADLDDYRLPVAAYDLIVVFYYLERRLIPDLRAALRPGGLLVYETFNQAIRTLRPEIQPRYLLEAGELQRLFAGWEMLDHHDGRPGKEMASGIVARRPAVDQEGAFG